MAFLNVLFKRLTTAEKTAEGIQKGKVIYEYEHKDIYVDVDDTTRVNITERDTTTSSTSENAISAKGVYNSIINTNTTNVAGYMADARQLNPSISGTLADKVDNRDAITLLATANSSSWVAFTVANLNTYKKIGFDFCAIANDNTIHYTEMPIALFKTKNTQAKSVGFDYNAQYYGNIRYVDDTHIEARTTGGASYPIYIYGIR